MIVNVPVAGCPTTTGSGVNVTDAMGIMPFASPTTVKCPGSTATVGFTAGFGKLAVRGGKSVTRIDNLLTSGVGPELGFGSKMSNADNAVSPRTAVVPAPILPMRVAAPVVKSMLYRPVTPPTVNPANARFVPEAISNPAMLVTITP